MLSSVSWSQFLVCLLVANIGYYLGTWILVYKAKFPAFGHFTNHSSLLYGADDAEEAAGYFAQEIKSLLADKTNKAEIILALQQYLRKYSSDKEPAFREAVNRLIVSQCETICSIRLGDSDLRAVWA